MMTLCCKALRFQNNEASRPLILGESEIVLAQAERVSRQFLESAEGDGDVDIVPAYLLVFPEFNIIAMPPEICVQQHDTIAQTKFLTPLFKIAR